MPRPQFRLRSLFILTAIVAVGCLVGPWGMARYQEYRMQREAANWKNLPVHRAPHYQSGFLRLEQQKRDAQLKASTPNE